MKLKIVAAILYLDWRNISAKIYELPAILDFEGYTCYVICYMTNGIAQQSNYSLLYVIKHWVKWF